MDTAHRRRLREEVSVLFSGQRDFLVTRQNLGGQKKTNFGLFFSCVPFCFFFLGALYTWIPFDDGRATFGWIAHFL